MTPAQQAEGIAAGRHFFPGLHWLYEDGMNWVAGYAIPNDDFGTRITLDKMGNVWECRLSGSADYHCLCAPSAESAASTLCSELSSLVERLNKAMTKEEQP